MRYKVATLILVGDEGYPSYSDIEEIEAVSEKQAVYFYEKKHNISYREHMRIDGRMGVIYDPVLNDFRLPKARYIKELNKTECITRSHKARAEEEGKVMNDKETAALIEEISDILKRMRTAESILQLNAI